MTTSRTILIETNRLFREGLKHLLNGTRFEVGAEFNTVDLALTAAETAGTPDLVISGQAVTDESDLRALRQAFPTARIVVLADDLSVDVLRAAMGGGADGFLIKSVAPGSADPVAPARHAGREGVPDQPRLPAARHDRAEPAELGPRLVAP